MAETIQKKVDDWNLKRGSVIEAAAALFAARGVDAVSMRDIGSACGLHMSTLYHYFPNKAALFEAVCSWACIYASETCLRPLRGPGTAIDRLRAFSTEIIRFFVENGPAAGVLDRELLINSGMPHTVSFPPITSEPVIELAALLRELSPPLLQSISAERLSEIVWDVAYGISRYQPAHFRIMPRQRNAASVDTIASEAWLVLREMLALERIPEAR